MGTFNDKMMRNADEFRGCVLREVVLTGGRRRRAHRIFAEVRDVIRSRGRANTEDKVRARYGDGGDGPPYEENLDIDSGEVGEAARF
mgnify:FL=1